MSDCFDHYTTAMEDNMPGGYGYEHPGSEGSSFNYDPLFYHINIRAKVLAEVGAAYLIQFSGLQFTIPQSICRRVEDDNMYVHTKIFKSILKNNLPNMEG